MLGIDWKVLSRFLKGQILTVVLQKCEKSAAKTSIEKPILNFVNLSPTLCPRLSQEKLFYL